MPAYCQARVQCGASYAGFQKVVSGNPDGFGCYRRRSSPGDVWAAEPEGAVADSRKDCSEEKPQDPPDWPPKLLGAQYDNIYQNMPPFHRPYEGANSLTFRNSPGRQVTQVYGVYFGSQFARGLRAYADGEFLQGTRTGVLSRYTAFVSG